MKTMKTETAKNIEQTARDIMEIARLREAEINRQLRAIWKANR